MKCNIHTCEYFKFWTANKAHIACIEWWIFLQNYFANGKSWHRFLSWISNEKTRLKLNFGIVRLHMTSALDYYTCIKATKCLKCSKCCMYYYYIFDQDMFIEYRTDNRRHMTSCIQKNQSLIWQERKKTIHGLNELPQCRIAKYENKWTRPLRSIPIYSLNIYDLMTFFLCCYSLYIVHSAFFSVEWIKISCCSTSQ